MTQLEALDGLNQRGVISIALLPLGRQIVGNDETPAQQGDLRSADARRELGVGRKRGPAAAYLDRRVTQQRFLDALVSALVENRIGRERQRRRRPRLRRRGGLDRCPRRLGRRWR